MLNQRTTRKFLRILRRWWRCAVPARQTKWTEHYASIWKESAHRFRKTFYFAELFDELSGKGAFELRHSFSSVIFVRKFLVQLRMVYASSITTVARQLPFEFWQIGRDIGLGFMHHSPPIMTMQSLYHHLNSNLRNIHLFKGNKRPILPQPSTIKHQHVLCNGYNIKTAAL